MTDDIKSTKNDKNPMVAMYDEILETDILDLIGAKNLSEDEKNQLYKTMLDTISDRVFARVDAIMSDDEVKKMKDFAEKNDKNGFDKFIAGKGLNMETMFQEEAALYKVELLSLVSQGGQNANQS